MTSLFNPFSRLNPVRIFREVRELDFAGQLILVHTLSVFCGGMFLGVFFTLLVLGKI